MNSENDWWRTPTFVFNNIYIPQKISRMRTVYGRMYVRSICFILLLACTVIQLLSWVLILYQIKWLRLDFLSLTSKTKNHSENGNIKIRNKLKTLHIHNNLGFATYRRMMRLINRFRWPPIIRYTSYEAIIGDLRRPKRAELRDKVLFLLYSNSSLIIVHICCSLSSLDNVEKKKKRSPLLDWKVGDRWKQWSSARLRLLVCKVPERGWRS